MMKVAIRDDDTSYFTSPQDLEKAYDFLHEGDCVSLSIVPYTVPIHKSTVFPYGEIDEYKYYDVAENTDLIAYLKEEKKKGTYDFLLHGFSHEYKLVEDQWQAEMLWKTKQQLKQELPEGKQHLEELLDCPLTVFVAPNNRIDQKAISVVEEMQMHYSGIIGFNDREINLRYIRNFIKRWSFRITKKIQYPGILDYGKHKELAAHTIDSFERLVREYNICKQRNTPFVIYTHYWQLNADAKKKEMLIKIYNYVINDGANVVPLSSCF